MFNKMKTYITSKEFKIWFIKEIIEWTYCIIVGLLFKYIAQKIGVVVDSKTFLTYFIFSIFIIDTLRYIDNYLKRKLNDKIA